jgi:hypothetical protein
MSRRLLTFLKTRRSTVFLLSIGILLGVSAGGTRPAGADHHSVQPAGALQCANDPGALLVQILMEDAGENLWTNCIQIDVVPPGGVPGGSFVVGNDPPSGANAIAGIGSQQLKDLWDAGTPGAPRVDVVIPAALANAMMPGGQICYRGPGIGDHPSGVGCRDVDPICQTIQPVTCGCDGVPNSGLVVDECGVCGGDGSTCGSVCGDVSGDGVVSIGDALMIAQYGIGLRTCGQLPSFDSCDIDFLGSPDGVCNIGDALQAAQCEVGLIPCDFTCLPGVCTAP